ncbi:MAG: hypothetical protein LW832_01315 [Parachlamydia sp.]|jgi:hypothetical protein|nr:hypothetical protein [Parachlamydia sp.]
MLKKLFIFTFFIQAQISGHPITLGDSHLSDYSMEQVEVRGFLYMTPTGQVILASRPDVKSCCLGAPSKLSEQLFLPGFESKKLPKNVVTLQGLLHFSEQGSRLEKAQIINGNKPPFIWLALICLIGVGAVFKKLFF